MNNTAAEKMTVKNYFTPSMITKLAIFAALSFTLYMVPKIMLPVFPFFLELNFSDIPALICGFVCGPLSAVIVVSIKILLKLPFTSTACVGELGDLIIGIAFAAIPALIYKQNMTMKFALIGLIAGTVASIAAAILSNIFLLVPFYTIVFYEGDLSAIVDIISDFAPGINEDNFYGLYSLYVVIPFNLLRCAVAAAVTFPLFKRIAVLLDKINIKF